MKILAVIILALAATLLVGRALFAPIVRAQSVENATKELTETQADLRAAITATTHQARAPHEHLATEDPPTTLSADVAAFLKATKCLERLRDELRDDIDHLSAASTRTLATFDHERSLITDPMTRRAMTSLRTQTQQQTLERLTHARAALELLNRILIQAGDLAHTAQCVQLAEELTTPGAGIDEQVRRVTDEATAYTRMANGLLSRLTAAYRE